MTAQHTPSPWDFSFNSEGQPIISHYSHHNLALHQGGDCGKNCVYCQEIKDTVDNVEKADRRAVLNGELLEAAKQVVCRWEDGDLAGAVRNLEAAIHNITFAP
jgi:wyosine [tRNA(Phe)-imidazoG37] synthetase (radical SAM superfamily)